MQLTKRFDDALIYAHDLHHDHERKGTNGVPYFSHLMSVAALVLEAGGDEDCAIAALLHDAPEDCGGAPVLEEIRQRFGERVAEIVAGCTDTMETPKPAWKPRKEAYLAHLREASDDVRLVSVADKLHNARSILTDHREFGERVFGRFDVPVAETMWYHRALADEFNRKPDRLTRELEQVVKDLEQRDTSKKPQYKYLTPLGRTVPLNEWTEEEKRLDFERDEEALKRNHERLVKHNMIDPAH